ncbi:histidine kinase [Neolewinella lacunae]|uniref:Histidine kinase n=1 Tax=Neolewinella lacunae TaxID=1517758 RepID=A0A923T8T1_9BACT|nr:histidine kinase [Neolewinella lacunae]MBC6995965.1 histidine kinase [Neolewinella lacunae]MDN3635191.1 histidine kinase [Neolewinella lacunae]
MASRTATSFALSTGIAPAAAPVNEFDGLRTDPSKSVALLCFPARKLPYFSRMKNAGAPWWIKRKEVLAFLAFYGLSSLVLHTVSWISYGGVANGHAAWLNSEEFWASSGAKFMANLLLTLPIAYLVLLRYPHWAGWKTGLLHLLYLPFFVLMSYWLVIRVKGYFGWVNIFGGRNVIWLLYMDALFYLLQFGLMHAYVFQRRLQGEMAEKADLREAALQSQLTALKAQLNPHFLHNLFNTINASIPPENERTRELVIKLSDLFRYQNKASQREYTTVGEELAFIRAYLDLIEARFKEKIRTVWAIAEGVDRYPIAPMLLQPLVENAVTHGLGPQVGAGELSVRVSWEGELLAFEIRDTGVGLAAEDREKIFTRGLGLANTRLRLQRMYGTDLHLANLSPSGLGVSFRISVATAAEGLPAVSFHRATEKKLLQ